MTEIEHDPSRRLQAQSLVHGADPDFLAIMTTAGEHGDCSIVSAQANQSARNFLDSEHSGRFTRQLFPICEPEQNLYSLSDVVTMQQRPLILSSGEKVQLALIRPAIEAERSPVVSALSVAKKSLHGFRKKNRVQNTLPHSNGLPAVAALEAERAPRLVGLIGDDIYVPLASFVKKDEPGLCNFIQLGGEMEDDNYFTTPRDERTSRLQLIRILQNLIEGKSIPVPTAYDRDDYEEKQTGGKFDHDILLDFVEGEYEKYTNQLLAKKEGQLVRKAVKKFNASIHTAKKTELNVLDVSGEIGDAQPQTIDMVGLTRRATLASGRSVQLALGWQNDAQDLTLYSLSRQRTALPIARLLPDSMQVEFLVDEPDESSDRLQFANEILRILSGDLKKEVMSVGVSGWAGSGYDVQHLGDVGRLISTVCAEQGLLVYKSTEACRRHDLTKYYESKMLSTHYSKWDLDHYTYSAHGQAIRKNVTNFLADPTHIVNPFPNSHPLKLALARAQYYCAAVRRISQCINLDDQYEAALGPTSSIQEALLSKIVQLSDRETKLEPVILQEELGLLRGSESIQGDFEVVVSIELDKNETVGRLRISGKPAGMHNVEHSPYVDLVFDVSQPLFSTSDERSNQRAANIYNLLLKIDPGPPNDPWQI